MKAMVLQTLGKDVAFEEVMFDDPKPQPGHVLVDVKATSINIVDTKIRNGMHDIAPDSPIILGCDVAGVVLEVGEGVSSFKKGDEIYGCIGGIKGNQGAYADRVVVDVRLIAHKPSSLTFVESAALPLVSITAWEALVDRAQVRPGETVLVHGGTGGVGHIGIQLAKALGAEVHTTVSSQAKAEIAVGLGADKVIIYPNLSVSDYVNSETGGAGYDVVFDTVGSSNIATSLEALAVNGRCVSIVSLDTCPDLTPLHMKNASLHLVFMLIPLLTGKGREAHGNILKSLSKMVDNDRIKPLIDKTSFSLNTLSQAHNHLSSGKALGKVVVEV